MNRKQKIITTIALVVFVLVNLYFMAQPTGHGLIIRYVGHDQINGEAKVAWIMIGVVYAALFFMFKEKKPPQLKQKLEPKFKGTDYPPTHHFPQAPRKDGDDAQTRQMRSDQEIENEIAALKLVLKPLQNNPERTSAQARWTISESIKVLEQRMSAEEIKREYYPPPSDDYQDGDNVMFIDQMRVHAWMTGQEGYTAPSKSLKSLYWKE